MCAFRFRANTVPITQTAPEYADMTSVMSTYMQNGADYNNVWPNQIASTAGVYSYNYYAMDVCGRTAMATATLDYRCNNPPVPKVKSGVTQSFTVQLGQVRLLVPCVALRFSACAHSLKPLASQQAS